MKPNDQRCSKCEVSFDPLSNRAGDLSWTSIFTRQNSAVPLGEDIESFDKVRCPGCGQVESAPELRIFGVIPGNRIKFVLGALLIVILAFGYWLTRTTAQ